MILLNKKVIGKMKDDVRGNANEFVGLKWKKHYLVTVDHKEIKKAKGVNKNIVDNIIRQKKYGDVLFDIKIIKIT